MRRGWRTELREDAEFKRLLDEVVERRLDPASAATTLLERHEADRAVASRKAKDGGPSRVELPAMDDYLKIADRTWPTLSRPMGGHAKVYRATNGLIGHRVPGVPEMLLLDHVGAKSGTQRYTPLVFAATRASGARTSS